MKRQTYITLVLLAALVVGVPLTASAQNRQPQEGKAQQSKQQKERDDRDEKDEEDEDEQKPDMNCKA